MHVLKIDMARDSAIKDHRVLAIPGSLTLETGGASIARRTTLEAKASVEAAQKDLNLQILELTKKQEMEMELLRQTYQQQEKQLQLQHQLQFQYAAHSNGVFQELREQQMAAAAAAEEQQRRELDAIRRKENASSNLTSLEVKQKLQNFLMKKQAANGTSSPTYRNLSVVKSPSGESIPSNSVNSSHPYKIPQPPSVIARYDSDFPLRKTASEPNLLRLRLKQSVIERKARIGGPLANRRQERLLQAAQRRQLKQNAAMGVVNCPNNTPESGPNSPPTMAAGSRGSPTSAPIQEENEDPQYQGGRESINDLSLYTSPSMPNISLGRPHLANSQGHPTNMGIFGLRTPSQTIIPQCYQPMPPIAHQPEMPPQAHSNSTIHLGHLGIHQTPLYSQPITDAQVAQARLYKQIHRPLGRTQSAPLPLGHPMLTGSIPVNISPTHYENSEAERQAGIMQQMINRINCNINCEPQLKEEDPGEVIDLTDKKQPPKKVLTNSVITSTSQQLSSASSLNDEHLGAEQDYFQQQYPVQYRQPMHVDEPYNPTAIKPLSRTLSSPLVHSGPPLHLNPQQPSLSASSICSVLNDTGQMHDHSAVNLIMKRNINSIGSYSHQITTGLAFDSTMLKHSCSCGNNSSHPEHSGRLQSIWARLGETGLAGRCDKLRSRKASQEELQTVHSENHALMFGSNQLNRRADSSKVNFVRLPCGGIGVDSDTTWNEQHTAAAARMAVGCVIDLVMKTAKGDIRNGFAVVRPPGHHAEHDLPMGFCFFNSVAIAAKLVRQRVPSIQKILIVDWDVHHGNGTQQAFYEDPNVLYISLHRHDDGNFFPGTGGPTECGAGQGNGFNVNIPWSGGLDPPLGDAEYLAAFRTIVMPIARNYNPDMVIVSAGFDAAAGHPPPLGGYVVSPACFGHLTKELMQLANGKIILALEGGYDLPAICDSAQECVKALLGDEPAQIMPEELTRQPCKNAINTLQKTIAIQQSHWPCLKRLEHTLNLSIKQAIAREREESETVTAMAGLSMQSLKRTSQLSIESTEEPMDEDEPK